MFQQAVLKPQQQKQQPMIPNLIPVVTTTQKDILPTLSQIPALPRVFPALPRVITRPSERVMIMPRITQYPFTTPDNSPDYGNNVRQPQVNHILFHPTHPLLHHCNNRKPKLTDYEYHYPYSIPKNRQHISYHWIRIGTRFAIHDNNSQP